MADKAKPKQTAKPKQAAQPVPKAQEPSSFTPWSTEQKKEYGKQFSNQERASYHKGRESAYRHAANMAGRQAKFLRDQENSK